MTKIDRNVRKKRESNSLYERPVEKRILKIDPSPELNKEPENEPKSITIKREPKPVQPPEPPVQQKPETAAYETTASPAKKAASFKSAASARISSFKSAVPAKDVVMPGQQPATPQTKWYYIPVKKKHSKKPLIITLIVIVVCLAAIYFAGSFIWKERFMPNTYINAQNVSSKDVKAAEALLLPQNTDFRLTVQDGEEAFPLSAIDYNLSFQESLDDLIESQNRFAWPLAFLGKKELDNAVTISYDKDLLEEELKKLDAFNEEKVIDPQDAHIGRGPSGHYELIPEVIGNRLDYNKSLSLITEALDTGIFETDLVAADCYLKPSIYSDNKILDEQLQFVKAIGETTITIDMTGATVVLEPLDLKEFVDLDAENNITIKDDALANYVEELAEEYDTYLTQRKFTTHTGQVISVGGNHTEGYGIDTYGFLMNKGATEEILRSCILSRSDQYITPSWDVPALTRDDVNGDIGDTYIEVSLSEQHLWYYVDGVLIYDDDVVTGLDTDLRRTPWGVFRAFEKDRDCILKGELAGERWNTRVAYWISVTWNGIGIHDATWQPMFGGDWYLSGGSHGCINVTYDTAEFLYNNLAIDTPIVIY